MFSTKSEHVSSVELVQFKVGQRILNIGPIISPNTSAVMKIEIEKTDREEKGHLHFDSQKGAAPANQEQTSSEYKCFSGNNSVGGAGALTMAEEARLVVPEKGSRKRKLGKSKKKNGSKGKKMKTSFGSGEKKARLNPKLKKLFRKRARGYNSDEEEAGDSVAVRKCETEEKKKKKKMEDVEDDGSSDEGDVHGSEAEEEDGEIQPGIMRLNEGSRAFRVAFKNIIKKHVSHDSLGPVMSSNKQLVAKKLTDDAAERKLKGEAKKEKHLEAEKGHVKPANYLDSHEKFLIGVATKGVVKLFNAVTKAQHAQKGLNPSRTKDAKVLRRRRKEAFFSELGKGSSAALASSKKENPMSASVNDEAPGWAPLRDNYMLTNPKLKDWDKMPDANAIDEVGRMSEDSGSDDD